MHTIIVRSVVVSLLIWGSISSAESVMASTVTPLTPTNTLFTYTFSETFINREVVIPLLAGLHDSHSPLTARFTLNAASELPSGVSAFQAAILSDAALTSGGYQVAPGQKQTYMLVVLVTHDETVDPATITPRLTSLPFLTLTDGVVSGQSVKTYETAPQVNASFQLVL